jgi:hypothetical protein
LQRSEKVFNFGVTGYSYGSESLAAHTLTVSSNDMKPLKIIKWSPLALIVATIIYAVGLLMGLPLIPIVKTDYFVNGTNQAIASGLILKQTDNCAITLNEPNKISDNEQSISIAISSKDGQHDLTINDFSLTVFYADQREIKKENTFLNSDNESEIVSFTNRKYLIAKSEPPEIDKHVYILNVFNTDELDNFKISIKLTCTIDNITYLIKQKLELNKKQSLTWIKFKLH